MGRLADVVVSVSARSFGVSCGGVGVLRRVVGKRTALTALVFDAVLAFLAGTLGAKQGGCSANSRPPTGVAIGRVLGPGPRCLLRRAETKNGVVVVRVPVAGHAPGPVSQLQPATWARATRPRRASAAMTPALAVQENGSHYQWLSTDRRFRGRMVVFGVGGPAGGGAREQAQGGRCGGCCSKS